MKENHMSDMQRKAKQMNAYSAAFHATKQALQRERIELRKVRSSIFTVIKDQMGLMSSVEHEVSTLQTRLTRELELNKRNADSRSSHEAEITSLQDELNESKRLASQLKTENNSMTLELKSLNLEFQTANEMKSNLLGENEKLMASIKTLEFDIARLTDELQASVKENQLLLSQQTESTSGNKKLNKLLSDAERRIGEQNRDMAELSKSNSELNSGLLKAVQDVKGLQVKLSRVEKELSVKENQLLDSRKRQEEQKAMISTLKSEILECKRKTSELEAVIHRRDKENYELQVCTSS